jgi:hypothetical protein
MKKHSAILCESLRYACLIFTIAFGLTTIVGTGGGGDGGGSGNTYQSDSQNFISPSTAPGVASSIGKITTGVEGVLFAITVDVGSGA